MRFCKPQKVRYLMIDAVRNALYWAVMMFQKIRGLDFIKKDTSVHSSVNNGYGFTDWMQIREIVRFIRKLGRDEYMKSIVDVGCGKGYVLARLSRLKGSELVGIESERHLVDIAQSNFSRMGIGDRIKIVHDDAINYKDYKKHSLIFMYYPFPSIIMRSFLNKLLREKKGQSYLIVYVHPNAHDEIIQTDEFTLLGSLHSKLRSQNTNIYLHQTFRQEI